MRQRSHFSQWVLGLLLLTGVVAPAAAAPPYLGVSYYPTVAGDAIDADIVRMKEIGINLVRFGDFDWMRMEPQDNQFEFGWIEQALDRFHAAGIDVVLCTPTASPPIWLTETHPEIGRINPFGQRIGHGGRRSYCPNDPLYRQQCREIAEALGKAFGKHPAVVAWQIDNELWEKCYCEDCANQMPQWLARRFDSIDALNRQWLNVLWSQEYQRFDQVPLPNPQTVGAGHHPSLNRAYSHFMSDSYIDYLTVQVEALRRHTDRPITTNGHNPHYQNIDYTKMFAGLDVVCTDSYAGANNLARYAFEADWMRPMGKPFWLAETSSASSGGTTLNPGSSFLQLPGALRAKIWLMFALGSDQVSFWLWQTHWAGQELEHGALLYAWGDEQANTGEVREAGAALKANADWLRRTRPAPARVAMHYSVPMQWIYDATPMAPGFNYDDRITSFHRLLTEAGIARDVIDPAASVSQYQTVFSPYLPEVDPAMLTRMKAFVEAGGTWVLGPLAASRTAEATAWPHTAWTPGLEEWLGVHVRHRIAAFPQVKVAGEVESGSNLICEAFEIEDRNRALAQYRGAVLDGMAAVVECPIGQGRVIVVGTGLSDAAWNGLLASVCKAEKKKCTPGVEWVERQDADGKPAGWIAVNTTSQPGELTTGDGRSWNLAPYQVLIEPAAAGAQ